MKMNNYNKEILSEIKDLKQSNQDFNAEIKELNDSYADKIKNGLGELIKSEIKVSKETKCVKENRIKKFLKKLFYTCK